MTAKLPPAVYVLKACRNLETDLQLGFTTVRDAAGLDPSFREAIDQGLIKGPRLFLSVTPLSQSGGSNPRPGIRAGPPTPRNMLGIYPEICDGPDQVRAAARRTLGRGADHIKMFADGEVLASRRPTARCRASGSSRWRSSGRRWMWRRPPGPMSWRTSTGPRRSATASRRVCARSSTATAGRGDGPADGRSESLLRADARGL